MTRLVLLIGGPEGCIRMALPSGHAGAEFRLQVCDRLDDAFASEQDQHLPTSTKERIYRLYAMHMTPSRSRSLDGWWLGVYSRTQ